MNKRDLPDLFQVLIDNMHRLDSGLCMLTDDLAHDEVINILEYRILLEYIRDHPIPGYLKSGRMYFWKPGNKTPRINWLKKQIQLTKISV